MSKKISKENITTIIGLSIMLGFSYLPITIPEITPIGMKVLGVFIGCVVMWASGNMLWPSVLGAALLGWYGFLPMGTAVKNWWGDSVAVMIFFLLILVGVFTYHGATEYVGRFFITRKIIEGRPWVFTALLLLGVYVMSVFVNPFAGVFLFLPVIKNLCDSLGFDKKSEYTKMMIINVALTAQLGFPTAFFNGTVLGLNSTYAKISGTFVNGGQYMMVTVPLGFLIMLLNLLVLKFIFKPDVEPLRKLTVDQINKNPLPPMNIHQKMISGAIVAYILALVLPLVLPGTSLSTLLSKNINGIALTLVGILFIFSFDDKPVIPISDIMGKNFSWPIFFMIASTMFIGGALTHESVGFTKLLQGLLTPVFSKMSLNTFYIMILLVGIAIANIVGSSVVLVLILQPVIYTYAQIAGIDSWPIMILINFLVMGFAILVPSASPYAATMFAQKEYLTNKDVYKYGGTFLIIAILVVLFIGIPLVNMIY